MTIASPKKVSPAFFHCESEFFSSALPSKFSWKLKKTLEIILYSLKSTGKPQD